MTEEFAIGLIVSLAIGQLVAWIGYWHWHSEAKYLRMMWKHEHEMNTALFDQIRGVERPKVFYADSAMMSNLTDEERKALEDADRGTIYPTMVEEPLPPGTVLHQLGETMPEWDELIKTVKRTWASGVHANDMTLGEIEEDISCALDRFAKANGLPEINWEEEENDA